VAAGCVPTSPRTRADLDAALKARTGFGVGAEARRAAAVPESVQLQDGLTEDEAVALALWNNPDLQGALARLGFAKGDLQEAGALPNPVFSILFPLGPKQLEMTLFQTLGALVQRPARVAAASKDVERVAEELVAAGLDTARDVRVAYAELYLAQARLTLLTRTAEIWARMANLARARLDAGAASQLEVTAVVTDARTAELDVARQEQEALQRRAELLALLNLPADVQVDLQSLSPPSEPGAVPEDLMARALAGRPEVRAAELAMEAAGERAGVERAKIFDLMLLVDANGSGTKGFELSPGLQATLPIFYQNQGGRTRAAAEFEAATWRYASAQARVRREVEVARRQLARAQAARTVWPQDVVTPLETNVGRAEKAYAAGGATYLEVLTATRQLVLAQLQGLELEREARRAWAELRRSVGGAIDARH
jgi:cobalt-zinc-cadmium efflux system outer membrane protein